MPFSRTWNILEKRGFFKMAMEQFSIFVWESSKILYNGLNSIFVHFAICNSIHNPPEKNHKIWH